MDFVEKTQLTQYQAEAEAQAKEVIINDNTNNDDDKDLLGLAYKMTGRAEAFSFIEKIGNIANLQTLKQIKESKVYKHIPNCETWAKYCDSLGVSYKQVDEKIGFLDNFGEEFFGIISNFGIGYSKLRILNKDIKNGKLEVQDNSIIIEGEAISFDEKDTLKEVLENIIIKNKEEQDELKSQLKAKDKVIKDFAAAKEQSDIAYAKVKVEKEAFQKQAEDFKNKFNNVFTGTLKGVPENSKEQMAELIKFENNLQELIRNAYRLIDEELTEFNGNVLCSLLAQAMITFDDIRVKAGAKYKFMFEGGILTNEELNCLNGLDENTPLDFLK